MDTGLNNMKAQVGWAGATISTNTDTDSATIIDTQGFEKAGFTVHSGTRTDGSYLLKIMESDDSGGASPVEAPAYLVQNTLAASNTVAKVECKTTKRYQFLRTTSSAVTSGCVFKEATSLLSDPKNAPVT